MHSLVTIVGLSISGSGALAGAEAAASPSAGAGPDWARTIVSADKVITPASGWMIVHRARDTEAPGEVVGYAPLKAGENAAVAAVLNAGIERGDVLTLMIRRGG